MKGRHKADHVTAWVVPGSVRIKAEAEAEGLDRVFLDAGFEWREPGCSMCLASNGERVPPGQRSVSTSNRNFVGRQGPGARTHLASPAMAAAAAIKGAIADVEEDLIMDKFTKVTGVATPLMRQNVDTDLIIRIERLVDNVTRDGLGPYRFEQIRFKPDGSEDPDCIFNQDALSRRADHPQPREFRLRLEPRGRGVGAEGHGHQGGDRALLRRHPQQQLLPERVLLPVALPIHEIEQLADEMKASPGNARITVDLENCQVISPTGRTIPFQVDAQAPARHAERPRRHRASPCRAATRSRPGRRRDKTSRPWVWL